MIGSSLEVSFQSYSEFDNLNYLVQEIAASVANLQALMLELKTEMEGRRNPVVVLTLIAQIQKVRAEVERLSQWFLPEMNALHLNLKKRLHAS